MIVLTHHKVLNKIKVFQNVKDATAFYNALLVNRGLNAADLDMYKLDQVPNLINKKDFSFPDPNTLKLCIKEKKPSRSIVTRSWDEVSHNIHEKYWDGQELEDIKFNLSEPDPVNYRSVPTKDIIEMASVSEVEIDCELINLVEKLN